MIIIAHIPTTQHDYAALPNPHVAMNEYPNPPWNTTPYEWDGVYESNTPEWLAQQIARVALKYGIKYSTIDRYAQFRKQEKEECTRMEQAHEQHPHHEQKPQSGIKVVNGVLTDTHLYCMVSGKLVKKLITQPIEHVGDIMQLCLDYRLEMIAVLASSSFSALATQSYVDSARRTWDISSNIQYTRKGMCYFLSGWKKAEARAENETGNTVNVFYAAHNTDWNMHKVTDPITLLAAISYIEDVIGYPVRFKPSHVGRMLMIQENEKQRKEWVRPVRLIDNKVVCKAQVDDIAWKRPLNAHERTQKYLLAYDKNMMYSASCTGVMLGADMPIHVERPTFDMKKSLPGVWHCKISGTSNFDGVQLPHPTDGKQEGWFWTYTVKLLHEVGYSVDISEAWVWNEAHDTLRAYGERVWEARNALRENTARYPHNAARALAIQSVKTLANSAIGLLNHPPKKDGPTAYNWYRPDWRSLLIDNARYQMFWRIRSYLKFGYSPIGVHTDCLYYISDAHEHEHALTGTTQRKGQDVPCNMMERSNKLGGYKQKYAVTITREHIEALFDNPTLDITEINTMLGNYEKEQLTEKEA